MATRQRAAWRPLVMTSQAVLAPQGYQAPSRAGKRGITIYLPPDQVAAAPPACGRHRRDHAGSSWKKRSSFCFRARK